MKGSFWEVFVGLVWVFFPPISSTSNLKQKHIGTNKFLTATVYLETAKGVNTQS